jgi:hypothetical protein
MSGIVVGDPAAERGQARSVRCGLKLAWTLKTDLLVQALTGCRFSAAGGGFQQERNRHHAERQYAQREKYVDVGQDRHLTGNGLTDERNRAPLCVNGPQAGRYEMVGRLLDRQ